MAGFFRCSGSSGALTKQAYLPIVLERVNMLRPAQTTWLAGNFTYAPVLATANYVSDWLRGQPGDFTHDTQNANYYVSFGPFLTALDGTQTAIKIIESADGVATSHFLTAGFLEQSFSFGGPSQYKLVVFAQAAERTRIVLAMTDTWCGNSANPLDGSAGTNGVKAVYDLVGGQVAVQTVITGGTGGPDTLWAIPAPAAITPFGSGWYRCELSATAAITTFFTARTVLGKVTIDAGAGMAAEDSSYIGNGTSGVNVWRSNMIPPRAWTINNHKLFEDFLNTNGIDITNSKAPGFNVYINNTWPLLAANDPFILPQTSEPNTGFVSVANSIYTQTNPTAMGDCSSNSPAVWTGTMQNPSDAATTTNQGFSPANFTGMYFKLPAYFEARMAYNPNIPLGFNNPFWPAFWFQSLEGLLQFNDANWPWDNLTELDVVEAEGTNDPANQGAAIHHWAHGTHYSQPLHSYNPPVGNYDFTAFHTYAALWIPNDDSTNDLGRVITWFDNIIVQELVTPAQPNLPFPSTNDFTGGDNLHQCMLFGGFSSQWDYISAMTYQ